MLLCMTVVLLISSVYCDKTAANSNATVEAKEVKSNKTGGESSNHETKLRMLGNPNEHFQKQEMVNQYLSKSDPGNGRMGQIGSSFQTVGDMSRLPSNNLPNSDLSVNEQLRQNILNNIRGGQSQQNGPVNTLGQSFGPSSNPPMFGSSLSQSFGPSSNPPSFGSGLTPLFGPSSNPPSFGSSLGSSSLSFSPSSSNPYSSSNRPSYSSDKSYGGYNYGKNDGGYGQQATCNISGRILFNGDRWTTPGVCGLFTCSENKFRTLTTSCPTLSYQEEASCYVEEQDLSRTFPHCCPKLVCSSRDRSSEDTRKLLPY